MPAREAKITITPGPRLLLRGANSRGNIINYRRGHGRARQEYLRACSDRESRPAHRGSFSLTLSLNHLTLRFRHPPRCPGYYFPCL